MTSLADLQSFNVLDFSVGFGSNAEVNEESIEEKNCIFGGLAMTTLKKLKISYSPKGDLSPWQGLGRSLHKTLKCLSLSGGMNLLENLTEYKEESLEEVYLGIYDDMNESALVDFIKAAEKLKDIQIMCREWVVSESFRDTLKAVRKTHTKVDINAKKIRLLIGKTLEENSF